MGKTRFTSNGIGATFITAVSGEVRILSAIGGVEMALWDIFGKITGQPVVNLLGGPCRDRVRCYTHISEAISGHTIEERVAEAQQAVVEGWSAMKWDPIPANHLTLEPAQVRDIEAQLRAVREAVGPEIELMVEIHRRLTLSRRSKWLRRLNLPAFLFGRACPARQLGRSEKGG